MKKNQAKLPPGGVWRTIKGAKVYIKDGMILAGAGGKLSVSGVAKRDTKASGSASVGKIYFKHGGKLLEVDPNTMSLSVNNAHLARKFRANTAYELSSYVTDKNKRFSDIGVSVTMDGKERFLTSGRVDVARTSKGIVFKPVDDYEISGWDDSDDFEEVFAPSGVIWHEEKALTDYVKPEAIKLGKVSKSNQLLIEKSLVSLEQRFPGTLDALDGIYDMTDDSDIMEDVKELFDRSKRDFAVFQRKTIAAFVMDSKAQPPKRYLLYNGEMFKEGVRKRARHSEKKMREKGVYNIGNDIETATAHEFGHLLHDRIYYKNKNLTRDMMILRNNPYNDFVDNQLASDIDGKLAGKLVSEYATISGEEYFAECFAEYVCYDDIRDNAKKWSEQFELAWSQLVKGMALDLVKILKGKGEYIRYANTTT